MVDVVLYDAVEEFFVSVVSFSNIAIEPAICFAADQMDQLFLGFVELLKGQWKLFFIGMINGSPVVYFEVVKVFRCRSIDPADREFSPVDHMPYQFNNAMLVSWFLECI